MAAGNSLRLWTVEMRGMDRVLNGRRLFLSMLGVVTTLLIALPLTAQDQTAEQPPVPMPQDRLADSIQVYSQLLPELDAVERKLPHELWFVQEATINAVKADEPCVVVPNKEYYKHGAIYGLNPHTAIQASAEHKQEFKEILADFDEHCHEHWKLNGGQWKMRSPVQLLTPAEQAEFHASRSAEKRDPKLEARYKKSYALFAFSPVYFNHDHTVALVYSVLWCGDLCGEGKWSAFTRTGKDWIPLQIVSASWIS